MTAQPTPGFPIAELLRWAEDCPDDEALISADLVLTVGEFVDSVLRIAAWLRARGVRPGEVVGILLPPALEVVVSHAVLHEAAVSAAVPAGWDPSGPARFDWIVADRLSDVIEGQRVLLLDSDGFSVVAGHAAAADPRSFPSDDAVQRWIFSSGTTGAPKAVPLTVDMVRRRCESANRLWIPAQPFMALLGPTTASGFQAVAYQLSRRLPVLLPGTPGQTVVLLAHREVASIKASPVQLSGMVDELIRTGATLPALRVVHATGSPFPQSLARELESLLGVEVVNLYGSTEGGTVARRAGSAPAEVAGDLIAGCRLQIVDDADVPLADGETGLIRIRRDGTPSGYVGGVGEAFRDGWFYPGDAGRLVDGVLHLEGRRSELLNAAGVKIAPARVEAAALDFPGVRDAGCFSEPDGRGNARLVIAVVSSAALDPIVLVRHLEQQLGDAAPRHVVRVNAIPRNATGKLVRAALPRIAVDPFPRM